MVVNAYNCSSRHYPWFITNNCHAEYSPGWSGRIINLMRSTVTSNHDVLILLLISTMLKEGHSLITVIFHIIPSCLWWFIVLDNGCIGCWPMVETYDNPTARQWSSWARCHGLHGVRKGWKIYPQCDWEDAHRKIMWLGWKMTIRFCPQSIVIFWARGKSGQHLIVSVFEMAKSTVNRRTWKIILDFGIVINKMALLGQFWHEILTLLNWQTKRESNQQ